MLRLVYVLLLVFALGCPDPGLSEAGEPCLTSGDCINELLCIRVGDLDAYCMDACESAMRLCDDGRVCTEIDDETNVCFVGGDANVGDSCDDSGDCVDGAICILDGELRCRNACDTRAPSVCGEGQTCQALVETDGFCASE